MDLGLDGGPSLCRCRWLGLGALPIGLRISANRIRLIQHADNVCGVFQLLIGFFSGKQIKTFQIVNARFLQRLNIEFRVFR